MLEFSNRPYVVDCGVGVTRQFVEAGYTLADLHTILITHLHSYHVLELGPLLHTAWTNSPKREIRVYRPPGLSAMVRDFFRLMDYDVRMRMEDEKQADPQGIFRTSEFTEGPVFEDDLVAVTALRVVRPPMDHVYALKIRSTDRTFVSSADTCYFPPLIEFPHLASHVLGRILRRLPRDLEMRYGFRPLLVESFADAGYDGTCLRAANFLCVGETTYRGRQDREKRRGKTVKTVFLYELARNWRQKLGVSRVNNAPVLEPGEGLNAVDWAENEFGGAPLGDKRLSVRLVKSVGLLAAYPGQKINASSESDSTAINAFYRLIEMPAEREVTARNILAPHRERSVQRIRAQRTVLVIQNGTDLNFATRPGTDGLQVIGENQTGAKSLDLHMHATLAVTDTGLPLGVLRLGFDPAKNRSAAAEARRKTRRWLDGFADIARAVREVGGKTRVISVCDREADCFELFDAQRRCPRVEVLVRTRHDRVLGERQPKLFATMSGDAPDGWIDVEIDGLTARPRSSKKKARPSRRKRLANCELRLRRVTLPATETMEGVEPVTVSAVHIVETTPPEDEDPVQWFLRTTLKVDAAKEAAEIVGFYLQRWRIEDFFRVLKSGCRIEFLLFRTAERLQRAITINAVIAWRIMVMTLLGRQAPDCEPQLMFADHELDFLRDYALENDLATPDRLGDAVRIVAHLGGYRDRKHDRAPGNQIMWHGQTRLSSAALGHRIGFRASQRYALRQSE